MTEYILVDRVPVLEKDPRKFAQWLYEHEQERRVALTVLPGEEEVTVSTFFMGVARLSYSPVPLLFECRVFDGPMNDESEWFATWQEAEEGHKRMVAKVKASMNLV